MTASTEALPCSLLSLPIEQVRVKPGHNPRRRFPKAEHEELRDSIRSNGLIHPIAVRKVDGSFEIIAGERRWRATCELGWPVIDAKVFECSEADARRMSRVENLNRADLTVPEEAYLAQDQVDDCEGDYGMAARALGWSLSKLRHRLQLLHATSSVMDALMDGQILVGHVELLATLPADQQDRTLPKVIEHKATINQLKEQLQGFALPLEQAKFDKAVCNDCPHNSSQQSSLFAEHISGARCTNAGCFGEKTAAWIEQRRVELKDDYTSVELRTEVLPGKTIPLAMHGTAGVGREQFDACRGCAFRTCIIDNRVGAATGSVEGPLCGNTSCNAEKVAAYQGSITPQPMTVEEQTGTPAPSAGGRATTPAKPAGKPTSKQAAAEVPKAAKEEYQAIVRRAAASHVTADARILLSLAAHGLFKLGKGWGALTDGDLPAGVPGSYDDAENINALMKLDKSDLQATLVSMSSKLLASGEGSLSSRLSVNRTVVKLFGIDPAPFVQITETFLKNHTVPAIHGVLDESGFTAWQKAQPDGEKKLKALLGLGKAGLIAGVLASGYDFTGYVPGGVRAELRAK
ncbi:PRTRC system ParB family protein (plasmid) [Xanthomonas citri pv. citri]|uniref:PRTRC system ParB family protein n=1 Tax=Xanthomonas citri TaxID=346 RepID=UPI001931C961|nr:PRTRC system ParB family protein [Xanthomonas citri]QRD62723.1 PRTRC system ParB family protein [Xanthomonas citri pv. citri]QRD67050.1 PRTRC system ParB family protein [Xanthomonas citri pv. citri]QRD71697.1 PRTRC system ParB family protein [Xanthomonas citri pv. citri]